MGALTHNGEVLQSLPANASQINFDKTGTNLNSTQTENAIKEVNTKVNTNANDIDQLKSGLTAVTNRISACNIKGQVVDLTQYTDANPFLIPSDGYVWVYSKTQKSTVIVVDHAYTNNLAVGSLEFDNAMYVKAGMYAYFVAAPGATNYVAEYKPLS